MHNAWCIMTHANTPLVEVNQATTSLVVIINDYKEGKIDLKKVFIWCKLRLQYYVDVEHRNILF